MLNGTGCFAGGAAGSFTSAITRSIVHASGSTFLLVAHCAKCSDLVSSLSTRIEVSGTEQRALPVSMLSSTVRVQSIAELTAVMRSPTVASKTAVKALLPSFGSTRKVASAASAPPASAAEQPRKRTQRRAPDARDALMPVLFVAAGRLLPPELSPAARPVARRCGASIESPCASLASLRSRSPRRDGAGNFARRVT